MNERIEELAKECYMKTGSTHTDHFAYWKFAELIVRECSRIALDYPDAAAEEIKLYFGVNE